MIRIVFFDCDGTITKVKSSWEYLHRRFNLWEDNADEYQRLFVRGAINYLDFCRRDALLWTGISSSLIDEIVEEIPYQKGVHECIFSLKSLGIITIILSTGISSLVERVRQNLVIDRAFSNDLLSRKGILTGEIRVNVDYDRKGEIVKNILDEFGLKKNEACAVGDGAGDKGMFEAVGFPVGFRPQKNIISLLKHTIPGDSFAGLVDIIRDYD